MIISDEEILDIARRRRAMTHGSRQRTVFTNEAYEVVGVVGEVALREFFGLMEHPKAAGGDGGIDASVDMVARDGKLRRLNLDVKTYINPINLWVDEGKARADVYVLAQYFPKKPGPLRLRAECIKWHWGEEMRSSPITIKGKRHHEIHSSKCINIDDLRRRYPKVVRLCACGDWGQIETAGKFYCFEHKPMVLF
jgi:hypothetical protein